MGELKASVSVDFSKAELKLQEIDRKQKSEDAKSEVLERRAQRIGQRLRDADAQARRIEQQLDNRIGKIAKRQTKTMLSAFAFDTLRQATDGLDNQTLKGLSEIAVEGLTTFAESGNPYVAGIAAAMKAVEVLKSAQTRLADELRNLKADTARRFEETERIREQEARKREEDAFDDMVARERIKTDVAKEENDLIWKTWGLMSGGGGN